MQIKDNWKDAVNAIPLAPFDNSVLAFFDDLSKKLVKVREYSDVATFGFWCRSASLLREKVNYDDLDFRRGRGVVFHSTPSNVPVNFAFSFAAGLLAGNANIIRLPGKDFEQVSIIVKEVNELLDGKYSDLRPYMVFVQYPPDIKMHNQFSSVCDVRVIWGGDETINELRQSPLKPRATEITFADRYSIAVINSEEYIFAADKQKIAQDFYNDTYFSDQNACTAPRIVFWFGNRVMEAKEAFWESIRDLAKKKYKLAPVQAVGKLAAFYNAAANLPVTLTDSTDSYVTRVSADNADNGLMRYKYNSGFFFEKDIEALEGILPVCGERLQTLVYYGFSKEALSRFLVEYKHKGIDRIVPMGKSMDFSLTWDGYDLIRQLSRKVVIS